MRRIPTSLVLVGLLGGVLGSGLQAHAAPAVEQATPARSRAVLGVGIDQVPPSLAAQLPASVAPGQGVLVTQVQPDSAAAAAGIRPFDILLSYDDQKLFSADQLVSLVASDHPGREVQLQVVRRGEQKGVKLTLGSAAPAAGPMSAPRGYYPHHRRPHRGHPFAQRRGSGFWEAFDSLSIEKLEGNRYKAEIEYLARDGEKKHHSFEGTREQIRDLILKEKDLPAGERNQLLDALDMNGRPPMMERFMPPMPFPDFDRMWGGWPPSL